MSDNNDQLTVQSPQGVPVASPAPAGPGAPATAPVASGSHRKARTRGIPAAPAALAAINTVAITGAGVASAAGPAAGIAAAGAMVVGAASMGVKRRRAVKRTNTQRLQRAAAKRSGMAAGPSASGSGPVTRSGPGGVGGGSGRPGSVKGGAGSSGSGSGSHLGSGSGPGGSRSGSHLGSGSGSKQDLGSKRGSGSRPGSEVRGPGSGGGSGVRGPGSSSPRTRRLDGSGPTSFGGRGRPRLVRSTPTRTSALRKLVGPRPAGSTKQGPKGGLIRRSDGSLRSVPNKIRHPLGGGSNTTPRSSNGSTKKSLRGRIGNNGLVRGARRIGSGARQIGNGARRVYRSRPGRVIRALSIGTARRAWGVGIPALAALAVGTRAALGRRGWRAVAQAATASWARSRARFAKHSKHGKAAAAKTVPIPAPTVNMPTTLVGVTPTAPAGGSTGGGFSMAQARFIEAAAEMLGAALSYRPEGMMQVGNDFNRMPEAFRNIANAMQQMAQRAHDEDPIHPAILDQMQVVYQHLQSAAMAAEELGPAFRSLHAVDIARLQAPRVNEAKWDVSANRDHVGGGSGGAGWRLNGGDGYGSSASSSSASGRTTP